MARAAVLGRLTWRVGTVVGVSDETATARTLGFSVPDWPPHAAGQHVDVRLTAEDGYTATRSYSLASAPDGELVELTVQRVPDGEVSEYLTGVLAVDDLLEIRGPVGGWFVWRPVQREPVQLIAGGSGIVPLMCILRARTRARGTAPARLLYSLRGPGETYYAAELDGLADGSAEVSYAYTRAAPYGWPRPAGRIDAALLAEEVWPASQAPTCYVCGPTGFVEAVADLLINAGHDPARIRTERFGPSGGQR